MFWIFTTKRTRCKTIAIAQDSMWNCCHLPILVCWTNSSSCSCFFTFYKTIPFQFSPMWCPSPALQNHQTKVNSYICCMSGSGWNVATPFINLPPVEKDNSINCVHGYLSTDPPSPPSSLLLGFFATFLCHQWIMKYNALQYFYEYFCSCKLESNFLGAKNRMESGLGVGWSH